LEELLKKREGYRLDVYKDPKKANKPTVGVGHLVQLEDKLKLGDTIDDKRVTEFFKKDSAKALAAARAQALQAGIKDADFVVYLASVNFQLGTGWNKVFKKTWSLIMEGKYAEAAKEVQRSHWYSQTPIRVKDFQKALLDLPEKKK
jgi:GH24 family phage-related lysozyme (muramidase)